MENDKDISEIQSIKNLVNEVKYHIDGIDTSIAGIQNQSGSEDSLAKWIVIRARIIITLIKDIEEEAEYLELMFKEKKKKK